MRQQDWPCYRIFQDVARRSTHEHFPYATVRIGTHHEQSNVALSRRRKQCVAHRTQVWCDHSCRSRDIMAAQVSHCFGLRGVAAFGMPVDARNLHGLGETQEGNGG
jgi:hypothetical protein